jgi:Winged helix-turn-helix DNA-binding
MADEIDLTQVQALLTQGLSQREIARRLSIPRSTLQSRLKQLQQEQASPIQAQVTEMPPRRRGSLSTAVHRVHRGSAPSSYPFSPICQRSKRWPNGGVSVNFSG